MRAGTFAEHVPFKRHKLQVAHITKWDALPQVEGLFQLKGFALRYKSSQKVHTGEHESLLYLLATSAYI